MTRPDTRLLNATSAGEQLRVEDYVTDMERFDLLPPPLRRQVDGNNTKMAAGWAEDQLRRARAAGYAFGEAVASVCRKTALTEGYEIAVFAGEYRAQCGTPYPHTEAQASIQRYGAMGPSRFPPRRFGCPVVPPRKRRRRRRLHAMVG